MSELAYVQRSTNLTRTQICVDRMEDGEPFGVLYNPFIPQPLPFSGYLSLIDQMDGFFDEINCPQAYQGYRSFEKKKPAYFPAVREVPRYMSDDVFTNKTGEKATFTIQVQFRQNATWQGSIAWMEGKKMQQFRSAIEMMKLIDSAMAESDESQVNWD